MAANKVVKLITNTLKFVFSLLLLIVVIGSLVFLYIFLMATYPPDDFPRTYLFFIAVAAWLVYRTFRKENEEAVQRLQRLHDEEILRDLTARANAHEPDAMFDLGVRILEGVGIKADEKAGVSWIRVAALANDPRACLRLGYAHLLGQHGCLTSNSEALRYFEEAARQGDDEAKLKARQIRRSEVLRKQINASESAWQNYTGFFQRCGSEPEIRLLKDLILAADLKPYNNTLLGKILVIPQAKILTYRVDFLVDNRLVVEVDGESYHCNPTSFEADRLRDQDLILNGYQPIRFTAKQILRDSASAASKVIEVAHGLSVRSTGNVRIPVPDDCGFTI